MREACTVNRGQKLALWLGALVVVAMLLVPPWVIMYPDGDSFPRGCSPFWQPPPPKKEMPYMRIDRARLSVQCLAVAILAAAGVLTLHRDHPPKE